jgi:DNA-binding CsgD family transcriptional regulator
VCHGAAAHYLGLLASVLGRLAEAARHFEAALGMQARLRARPFLARTQYTYATMLLERGRPPVLEPAAGLLEDALRAAHELGMVRLAAEAQELAARRLRTAGGARWPHPYGLTARELEVLRLLAEGASSKAIAEQLVLSVHTVEHHLGSIYAKLGARGRMEAATLALRQGLLGAAHAQVGPRNE